uniref:Uncharacterized protein n=1 Tax=Arundo donax TaxID=35708 RepID=A0A0A8ZKV7_ARUDO
MRRNHIHHAMLLRNCEIFNGIRKIGVSHSKSCPSYFSYHEKTISTRKHN